MAENKKENQTAEKRRRVTFRRKPKTAIPQPEEHLAAGQAAPGEKKPAGRRPSQKAQASRPTPRGAAAQKRGRAGNAAQEHPAERPEQTPEETLQRKKSTRSAGRQKPRQETFDKPRLRVIPLGGLNEIGKNMTVLEYGQDIIVIDAGMTFPDEDLLGVDMVIPDITYLQKNRDKVKAIFLTHAHEDHIGALPYVLRELNVPVYCTGLTAGLVRLKLQEHKDLKKPKIHVRKDGDRVKAGCFEVEFIHVNHSVADACAFAVKTPVGVVVATGDFKIDTTPIDGKMIDLPRLGELGKKGVLLLMMDSTNAERPGMAMSERKVGDSLDREFKGCDQRIIVASFASNVHRVQQIFDVAAKYGRKVAVSGRSMENILKVGVELGYLTLPANTYIDLHDIRKYPKNKLTIITTGSQGEPMSALYRMAFSGHRQVEVGFGDKILISATPIPGNEKPVYTMINELFRKGADVVYERLADMHVSGHACQEELKMMLSLLRPKYFMPMHGEYRHLMVNAGLGRACGVRPENIFISDLGKVLEIGENGAGWGGSVPSGRVLVDGYGVGDVGAAVLRERKSLSESGMITVAAGLDMQNRTLTAGPEIISRGFIFVREAEELMGELRELARETLENALEKGVTSRSALRETVNRRLADYLYKKTKREPLVATVLLEK